MNNVLVKVAGVFSNDSISLPNKGRNYKMTPSGSASGMKELVEKVKFGLERTIAGIRYANRPILNSPISENEATGENSTVSQPSRSSIERAASRFNYTKLQPPKPANEEIESNIESLRKKIMPIIDQAGVTKIRPNHSSDEKQAFKNLLNLDNVSVLLTDKTNKICLLPTDLVQEKIDCHMKPEDFEKLSKDPSAGYEKEANVILKACTATIQPPLGKHTISRLQTRFSTAPTIYPMAKDHKKGFPDCKVRAVQPVAGGAVDKVDFIVSRVLSQILPKLRHRVTGSECFIRTRLKGLLEKPPDRAFQASIDVEAMYPSLPTENEALEIIHQYIRKYSSEIDLLGLQPHHIVNMLQFITTHTYATANGSFYRQKRGVGTGYHSSGATAEILVDYTYNKALSKVPVAEGPLTLALYVDDAYSLWEQEVHFDAFVCKLNSIWPTMRFTTEKQNSDGKLSFLDTIVTLRQTHEGVLLEHELFQKETHSGMYLNYESHCSQQTKWNIVREEARRAIRSCSSLDLAWKHLEKFRRDFIHSGYPPQKTALVIQREVEVYRNGPTNAEERPKQSYDYILKVPYVDEKTTRELKRAVKDTGFNIRLVTTPGEAVGNIIKSAQKRRNTSQLPECHCALHARDINCNQKFSVYKATCRQCGELYVGASSRPIKHRLNEHEASVRLATGCSSLDDHIREKHPPPTPRTAEERWERKGRRDYDSFFNMYSFSVVKTCKDTLGTFICEDIEIQKLKPQINDMESNGFIF